MESDFGAALAEWNAFYSAVAGVAATLVGLLFVALALNPRIMSDRAPSRLRVWSGQTFHSFVVVLVVALVALIPDDSRTAVVATLAVVGGTGLWRVAADARRARADPAPGRPASSSLALFVWPTAAYAAALWAAWGLARGDDGALGWLVAVVFFLLLSAAISCWNLLAEIGKD